MKLRIRGNSIRFRVTRSELERLLEDGSIEDSARFGPGASLRYRLHVGGTDAVAAELAASTITVRLPEAAVARWARPEQVSIHGGQDLGSGEALSILVEKDFECLEPRPGEDPSEFFANPLKSEA